MTSLYITYSWIPTFHVSAMFFLRLLRDLRDKDGQSSLLDHYYIREMPEMGLIMEERLKQ